MAKRKAFTLMEVLVSIALLGIILPALYKSVDILRDSNENLFDYLEKSKKVTRITETLYLDILSSDGNITIKKDEFSRLCMEKSKNSLYALSVAKVCWIVLKKENTLVRIEGNDYKLPLGSEERVEVNPLMKGIEIFDVYHQKDKVLVLLQQKAKEPISFMIQGVTRPEKKKKKKKQNKKKTTTASPDTNQTTPPVDSNKTVPSVPSVP